MIRSAKAEDADILTPISFESKGYWGYPKAYFEIWHNELTITPEYINKNDVLVFKNDRVILGYYSIAELQDDGELSGIKIKKGFWLEHMFIVQSHIGQGIGTRMFDHLRERCKERRIKEVSILADPNSRGFYEKMGCEYQKEFPSTIANRTTPLLVLRIGN